MCTASLYTYGMIYYYMCIVCLENMIICLNHWFYINMPIRCMSSAVWWLQLNCKPYAKYFKQNQLFYTRIHVRAAQHADTVPGLINQCFPSMSKVCHVNYCICSRVGFDMWEVPVYYGQYSWSYSNFEFNVVYYLSHIEKGFLEHNPNMRELCIAFQKVKVFRKVT